LEETKVAFGERILENNCGLSLVWGGIAGGMDRSFNRQYCVPKTLYVFSALGAEPPGRERRRSWWRAGRK